MLKPGGSLFVNLGDKYAGSGGHHNDGISAKSTLSGNGHTGGVGAAGPTKIKATKRSAPNRYTQASDGIRTKSLMGLPWRYAIGCIDGQADPDGRGWILRSEIVWSKPNGLPESVKDRVRRSHEQWFHLTKEGTYYSDVDHLRTEHPGRDQVRPERGVPANRGLATGERKITAGGGDIARSPLGALPSSVWTIATQPLIVPAHVAVNHFAAFPTEWPRRLILGWSPPGGVVLDPFSGTGTTAGVARALGRFGVGMDLSADYMKLARWRIWESGMAAKIQSRTDGERQAELFG